MISKTIWTILQTYFCRKHIWSWFDHDMARWWASCRLLGHELGLSSTVSSFSSKMPQNVRHFVYIFLSFVFQSVSVSVFQSVLLESCSRPLDRKGICNILQSFSSLAFACSFAKAWHIAGNAGEGIGVELRHGMELDCKSWTCQVLMISFQGAATAILRSWDWEEGQSFGECLRSK